MQTMACLETITELRTQDPGAISCLMVLGYDAPGDGGGGTFFWDDSFDFWVSLNPDHLDPSNLPPDYPPLLELLALQALFPDGEDGGTVIKPIGTGISEPGRWRRIFDGPISVKWFGAKGDQKNDDHKAIQAALNAAHAARGSVVFFPPGTYVVPKELTYNTLADHVGSPQILGAGRFATLIDNWVENGSCFNFKSTPQSTPPLKPIFQRGGRIENLSIITTKKPISSNGIELKACYQFSIRNVRVYGLTGDGIRITAMEKDHDGSNQVSLEHCWLQNNKYGLNVNASHQVTQVSLLQVRHCFFTGNTKAGVRYIGQQGYFENNAFTLNGIDSGSGMEIPWIGANNLNLTMIGNAFENNYGVQLTEGCAWAT